VKISGPIDDHVNFVLGLVKITPSLTTLAVGEMDGNMDNIGMHLPSLVSINLSICYLGPISSTLPLYSIQNQFKTLNLNLGFGVEKAEVTDFLKSQKSLRALSISVEMIEQVILPELRGLEKLSIHTFREGPDEGGRSLLVALQVSQGKLPDLSSLNVSLENLRYLAILGNGWPEDRITSLRTLNLNYNLRYYSWDQENEGLEFIPRLTDLFPQLTKLTISEVNGSVLCQLFANFKLLQELKISRVDCHKTRMDYLFCGLPFVNGVEICQRFLQEFDEHPLPCICLLKRE
jgi:hypothetical protein